MRQTTCDWIQKILDEETRIVNVFLISWFFQLFLLCSVSLLVKYGFILRYEAWVNAVRASSFIEISFLKSVHNQSLSSEIYSGSSHEIGHSQGNWPFSGKLALKIPLNFPQYRPFFPRICHWKSCEIWLFSRDLPEALSIEFILVTISSLKLIFKGRLLVIKSKLCKVANQAVDWMQEKPLFSMFVNVVKDSLSYLMHTMYMYITAEIFIGLLCLHFFSDLLHLWRKRQRE